ncbi:MAG: hypothetical protein WCJ37_03690 [Syntrophus sp. (in: bacteria)]
MDTKDDHYLTVKELSNKIKFSQQAIYNMIHEKVFIKGKHYLKPRPKKILFIWSAVLIWLESPEESSIEIQQPLHSESTKINKSLINI